MAPLTDEERELFQRLSRDRNLVAFLDKQRNQCLLVLEQGDNERTRGRSLFIGELLKLLNHPTR